MALRLANKINRNIIQNFRKVSYAGKVEAIANTTTRNINEDTRTKDVNVQKKQVYPPPTHIPPMMPPLTNSTNEQMGVIQSNTQMHQLQPSMMPDYYKHAIDMQHATYPKPPEMELPKASAQYRRFEKSTTYKSVKLPLKQTRLAGPFPDPVKVMPSDTMSDQEKAEQKTAEARLIKGDTAGNLQTVNFAAQQRSFSYGNTVGPDKKKCKKKPPKKCPSHRGPCKPPKSKSCDRDYDFQHCKKKCAPYPAYSEFCHTIPDEKPSECKMCPWKPSAHPTFKPPKKRFHTSSITFSHKKSYREKRQRKKELNNGWVKKGKWRKETYADIDNNLPIIIPFSSISPSLYLDGNKPCKRPNLNKCPPGSTKKDKKRKKDKKGKKGKKSKTSKTGKKSKKQKKSKKPKKKAVSVSSNGSWVTIADMESIAELPNLFNSSQPYMLASKKKKKGGKKKRTVEKDKCRKIPSGSCKQKYKPAVGVPRECPKSKKKKVIGDCPSEKCKDTAPSVTSSLEYLLDGKGKKDKKKKCPKVNMNTCKDDDDDDGDQPCGSKKKGTTKRCPSDLLVKRRRPATKPIKKFQNIITPKIKSSTSKSQSVIEENKFR